MNKNELIAFLKEKIAHTLDCDPASIEADENVHDLGLTSLNAVIISGDVEDKFDVEVNPTVMFENHTIAKIAEEIINNG